MLACRWNGPGPLSHAQRVHLQRRRRQHERRNPATAAVAFFAGGVLTAAMVGHAAESEFASSSVDQRCPIASVEIENIPDDLQEVDQWGLWRSEQGRKVPYQTNGRRA